MTIIYAGKADNNDELFRLKDVTDYLQYPDPAEVIDAYCFNTPQEYLDEGYINETDLLEVCKNCLDFDAVIELEEFLEKYILRRPLDHGPLHADRPDANRPLRRRNYADYPYFKAFPSEGQTSDSPDCPYYLVYPSAPNTPTGPAYYLETPPASTHDWGRR